jgi:hypothetical protein
VAGSSPAEGGDSRLITSMTGKQFPHALTKAPRGGPALQAMSWVPRKDDLSGVSPDAGGKVRPASCSARVIKNATAML